MGTRSPRPSIRNSSGRMSMRRRKSPAHTATARPATASPTSWHTASAAARGPPPTGQVTRSRRARPLRVDAVSMRIAFVSASSHFDVRFTKIAATVRQAGHDLVLIGLDRDPEVDVPSPPDGVVIRLLARQIPTRGALLRAVPAFARHVARQLRHVNPDVVYCRDEEGVMFALAARLLGCEHHPFLIAAIHDVRVEEGVMFALAARLLGCERE